MTDFEYQVATFCLSGCLAWVIVVWIEVGRGRRR